MPTTPSFYQAPYTISFDENANAFEAFYSYFPEFMGEVNVTLFTFKNGQIWQHGTSPYCNFYGTQYSASITTVFNAASLDKKTWISTNSARARISSIVAQPT